MLRLTLAFLGLAALPVSALAQDEYTIRKKPMAEGNTVSVDIKVRTKFEAQKWSPAGRSVVDTAFASDDALAFTVKPLEFSKEGKLLRFERHFTKAVRVQHEQTYELAFQGHKFLHVHKGGRDEILSEKGEKLAPALSLDLEKQTIPCDPARAIWQDVLPAKPVKVGESWSINPRRWIEDYEVDMTR